MLKIKTAAFLFCAVAGAILISACGNIGSAFGAPGPCPKGKNRVFCLAEFKGKSTNPNTPWKYCASKRSIGFCAKGPSTAWLSFNKSATIKDWYHSIGVDVVQKVAIPLLNRSDTDFAIDPNTGFSILDCQQVDANPWPNTSPFFTPQDDTGLEICFRESCDPGIHIQTGGTAGTQCDAIIDADAGEPVPNPSCGVSGSNCGLVTEPICCSSDPGTDDACSLSVCN